MPVNKIQKDNWVYEDFCKKGNYMLNKESLIKFEAYIRYLQYMWQLSYNEVIERLYENKKDQH